MPRVTSSSLLTHSPLLQEKAAITRVRKLFQSYGWDKRGLLAPELVLDPKYIEFLSFLYDSRLIFSIRGYEVSLQHSDSDMGKGIKVIDAKPHILVNGAWTPWDQITTAFRYDRGSGITLNQSALSDGCSYLYPYGLVQTNVHSITPAHQLSQHELDGFYSHGQGEKILAGRRAYLQIVTDGGRCFDRMRHVSLRLIDPTGIVYSIGFERVSMETQALKLTSLLGTCNAVISSCDYKEFKQFNLRRVTTVPLSLDTFQNLLNKVQTYAGQSLKHNYLNQNCVGFAADILQTAGISVDTQTSSVASISFNILAPEWMRKGVKSVQRAYARVPKWIRTPIRFIVTCLTFVPARLLTLVKNLIFLMLGAGREAFTLKNDGVSARDNQRFTTLNRLFGGWVGLFKDHPIDVPYKIIDWQNEQASTRTYRFEGPKFYI